MSFLNEYIAISARMNESFELTRKVDHHTVCHALRSHLVTKTDSSCVGRCNLLMALLQVELSVHRRGNEMVV